MEAPQRTLGSPCAAGTGEHEQVFLGRRGARFAFRVIDDLQGARRHRPSDHQQRLSAFGRRVGPNKTSRPSRDPEPLARAQVAAGARDAQVACRPRFHSPIIAGARARPEQATDAGGLGERRATRRANEDTVCDQYR